MPTGWMGVRAAVLAASVAAAAVPAAAQSASGLLAIEGLSPAAALLATPDGRAALAANLEVTGAIQAGTRPQPLLLPFAEQQGLAIRDAFITNGNAAVVADALGTRLAGIYALGARYEDAKRFTNISPALATLFAYTNATTSGDSNAAKYGLGNGTTEGKTPFSEAAAAAMARKGAAADVLGQAYNRPAGSPGADAFGNSRPFQTLPAITTYAGPDYFGAATTNRALLEGPDTDLRDSPSFPSGHTTYGTMSSLLLALLVPERYGAMVTRGAEYGNDRIILGAHYAMDVIAGRALAMHDLAHLLANDPRFVGRAFGGVTVTDYPAAFRAARTDLVAALKAGCGDVIAVCAAQDTSRFTDPAANEAFYEATLTYGLPPAFPARTGLRADVATAAPEAGHLLTAAFPHLSLAQANAILTETQGQGGGFLDDGSSPFGVYARLNLVAAGKRAAAMAPTQ